MKGALLFGTIGIALMLLGCKPTPTNPVTPTALSLPPPVVEERTSKEAANGDSQGLPKSQ